ncbi:hypothetical protein J7J74_00785 [bacterium]|nr:hypothetical protein [bacterium]
MRIKILIVLIILTSLSLGYFFVYKNYLSKRQKIEREIKVSQTEEKIEIPEIETPQEKATKEEKAPKEKEKIKTVNIPKEISDNCIGFLIGSTFEIETMKEIGAGWIRPHPGPFVWGFIEKSKGDYDFSITDNFVKTAQKNNVAILPTIWPFAEWDQKICRPKICEVSSEDQFYFELPKSRCAPCNMANYKQFLKKLVERYDGDGINDMPGLKIPIKYYEILNEPEMREPFLTFFKGTEKEYVEILKASFEAIKEVCPDCKVLSGGAAGVEPKMISFWSKVFDLGAQNYFDIANIHFVNFGDRSTLNVKPFKELLKEKKIEKPIWVTEAEYGKDKNQEIESTVEGALLEGAKKIFFTRFVIGSSAPPIPGQYSTQYINITSKCNLIK